MTSRKSLMWCIVGIVIGVVISPVMWLTYQDPLFQSLNPLCTSMRVVESREDKREVTTLRTSEIHRYVQLPNKEKKPLKMEADDWNRTGPVLSHVNYTVKKSFGDPRFRYRKLSQELSPRKLLFIGVVTAEKYLNTRAVAINNTWGRGLEDVYYFSSRPNNSNFDLPIITLPGVNDSVYPPQRKVYHMLKYMYDHFIDEYDFFMRSDDDVYIKTDPLVELMTGINPAQEIYMGSPGFGRPDDRSRIKLNEDEHYCMGGPGVIFSRSALRRLGPHLHTCLENVVVSYNEDVEVGRCVSKMLNLQCTWSWETSILFWTDYKRILNTSELYTSDSVINAITLHPIKDPRLMYKVHQYLQQLRLKKLMRKVSILQEDVHRISLLLPSNMNQFKKKRWLWYDMATNPKSRYEISVWDYFNSTRLFLTYEHLPVVNLPSSVRVGVNSALEVLIDIMNRQDAHEQMFVPPYHLFDGFMVTDHSSGLEYTLHMSVHRTNKKNPLEYVARVFMPFDGAGMAVYQEADQLRNNVVHLIVITRKMSTISEFLQIYDSVCLQNALYTHLHVVMFGVNERVRSQISDLSDRIPGAKRWIKSYELPEDDDFLPSRGYSHVAELIQTDDILLLMDPAFLFTVEFIWHVRMNVIRGQQAYFPILFSFYKPELVDQYLQRPLQMSISADTGFFLRYNYQVAAIYKSDYKNVNELEFSSAKGSVPRNDDVKFLDKVLSSDIYVFRCLEPYLTRKYRKRTCKGLGNNARSACMNSKADTIGSKKILGSMLIAHELLNEV